MPISITPVIPPQGSAPVALDQLLQAGAIVEARVLAQVDASLARILIASTAIEVTTETPLVPGTMLRLAVSRASDGSVRLSTLPAASTPSSQQPSVALPQINPPPPAVAASDPVAIVVVQTAQQAAPRQSGLSPLFADLAAALEQGQLPPQVRAAVAPLLAMRPTLSAGMTAGQLQQALRQSGLLLESSIAAGRTPQHQIPDLKAALIVLRQVLSQWQNAVTPSTAARATPASVSPQTVAPQAPPTASPAVAAQLATTDEFVVPLAVAQPANMSAQRSSTSHVPSASLVLTMLQDIAQGTHLVPVATNPARGSARLDMPAATVKASQPNAPPPPYRGAPPSAQPVAQSSLHADEAPQVVAQKLIDEVDGALARQTLLQIASLPDQPLPQGQRNDQPRWTFEIPFATPQGTAVAQFEISRDGHSTHEVEAPKRIWRARFSLNVEPAGPVHASIALTGERASVRLWADRPETIARLRDSAPLLSHALREAELDPGEITIGRPPQGAPAEAGQFWNKAS